MSELRNRRSDDVLFCHTCFSRPSHFVKMQDFHVLDMSFYIYFLSLMGESNENIFVDVAAKTKRKKCYVSLMEKVLKFVEVCCF